MTCAANRLYCISPANRVTFKPGKDRLSHARPAAPGAQRASGNISAMTPFHHSRRRFLRTSVVLAGTTPFVASLLHCAIGRGRRAAPRLCRHLQFSASRRAADAGGSATGQRLRHPPFPRGSRHRGADARRHSRDGNEPQLPGLECRRGPDSIPPTKPTGVGEDKQGTVSAFAVDRTDGHLALLNTVGSGGAGPTYVSIHPSGRFLLVANYFGGSVAVLPSCPTAGWATPRTSRTMPARSAPPRRPALRRAASPSADTTGPTRT